MQSLARPVKVGFASRELAWAHLIWKFNLIDKALRFDLQRCFRLIAAVGFRQSQSSAGRPQALKNQKRFRLGIPNWFCPSARSHRAWVLFLGEWPSLGIPCQEMGENLLMRISKVSEPRRRLGDESVCSQGEERPPEWSGAAH